MVRLSEETKQIKEQVVKLNQCQEESKSEFKKDFQNISQEIKRRNQDLKEEVKGAFDLTFGNIS